MSKDEKRCQVGGGVAAACHQVCVQRESFLSRNKGFDFVFAMTVVAGRHQASADAVKAIASPRLVLSQPQSSSGWDSTGRRWHLVPTTKMISFFNAFFDHSKQTSHRLQALPRLLQPNKLR